MGWKYIIMKVGRRECPVIFPDTMIHAHVSGAIKAMLVQEADALSNHTLSDNAKRRLMRELKTVSAGSLYVSVNGVTGHSDTLNLSSRQEDEQLINGFEYFHGVVG